MIPEQTRPLYQRAKVHKDIIFFLLFSFSYGVGKLHLALRVLAVVNLYPKFTTHEKEKPIEAGRRDEVSCPVVATRQTITTGILSRKQTGLS